MLLLEAVENVEVCFVSKTHLVLLLFFNDFILKVRFEPFQDPS